MPKLKERGVRVLIGGDSGFPFNPNGRNACDLEHFVTHFGFTPAEALRAVIQHGDELLGLETGNLREGCLADLLLVDGDPTQDVSILQDKDRLWTIMEGGTIHKQAARAEAA